MQSATRRRTPEIKGDGLNHNHSLEAIETSTELYIKAKTGGGGKGENTDINRGR